MQITVEVPEDIARQLAADPRELSRATLEAVALEGARSGRLTTEQVRRRSASQRATTQTASSRSTKCTTT